MKGIAAAWKLSSAASDPSFYGFGDSFDTVVRLWSWNFVEVFHLCFARPNMLLENIAAKILVNAKKYSNEAEAIQGLRSEFDQHFPKGNYTDWNKDVPSALAQNIITNVGKNSTVSVRFVIKDLDTISKNI